MKSPKVIEEQSWLDRGAYTMRRVYAELSNMANFVPARDVFVDWLYGQNDTFSLVQSKGAPNYGLPGDLTEINSNHRQIVVIAASAASLDYDYDLQYSRDGVNDWYSVGVSGTANASPHQIVITEAKGYDQYCRLVITPDAGQSDANAQFKTYLTGRGG